METDESEYCVLLKCDTLALQRGLLLEEVQPSQLNRSLMWPPSCQGMSWKCLFLFLYHFLVSEPTGNNLAS